MIQNDQPLISVVMSVYNGQPYLAESIESILGQSERRFEFIIVNDGSTDGTDAILAEYRARDPRVRVLTQDNSGLTKSLNRAVALSRGRYIARQDADDVSLPRRLEQQLGVLESHPDIDLVAGEIVYIDAAGDRLLHRRLPPGTTVLKRLKVENLICHSTVMFPRSRFDAAGGYDEARRYGQDKHLWRRMVRTLEIVHEPVLLSRLTRDNLTLKRSFPGSIDAAKLNEKYFCTIAVLFLQDHQGQRARRVLADHMGIKLFHPKVFFYYLLGFCPGRVIDLYFWRTRRLFARFR